MADIRKYALFPVQNISSSIGVFKVKLTSGEKQFDGSSLLKVFKSDYWFPCSTTRIMNIFK